MEMAGGNFAPVIIIVCNRYDHFRACIESLQKNTLAAETEIFIGLDYPPSVEYEEGHKKIADYLDEGIGGFKKVNIFKREYNFGVKNNVEDLYNRVMEKHDRFIVTEDDNVFSTDFLEYMNYYLELYKNDDRIFSICGHTMPDTAALLKESKHNIYAWHEFDGWGVALWTNKYKEFLCTVSMRWLEESIRKTSYIKALKMLKRKRYKMIIKLWSSDCDLPIQDTTFGFYQSFSDRYQICPCQTKVKNNGWDGSGIHCLNSMGKNEGVFDECTDNFSPQSFNRSLPKLGKRKYSKRYIEKINFRYEFTYFLIHLFGLKNAKKILAHLK